MNSHLNTKTIIVFMCSALLYTKFKGQRKPIKVDLRKCLNLRKIFDKNYFAPYKKDRFLFFDSNFQHTYVYSRLKKNFPILQVLEYILKS